MLETINILLTMFNMCNVHLLAINRVQIQIIIEETESGSEISSHSASSLDSNCCLSLRQLNSEVLISGTK